jgi:hypothetical protein
MQNILRKQKVTTYVPGEAAVEYNPGQPYRKAYITYEHKEVCAFEETLAPPAVALTWVFRKDPGSADTGYVLQAVDAYGYVLSSYKVSTSYVCKDTLVSVRIPEQQYVPPTLAKPAVPAQLLIDWNFGWNSGARSIGFISGNGGVSFKVPVSSMGVVAGLNEEDSDAGYTNINFAWYLSRGIAQIYENGVQKLYVGQFADGDIFSVERGSSVIRYKRNGSVVYVSSATSAEVLFLDVSMYSADDTIYDPSFYSVASSGVVTIPSGTEAEILSLGQHGAFFLPLQSTAANYAYRYSVTQFLPLTTTSSKASKGAADFSALISIGGDYLYGGSYAAFEPLKTIIEVGLLVPSYAISDVFFVPMTISATSLSGSVGGATVSFGYMYAVSSNHVYGSSSTRFESLTNYASAYEGNTSATLHSNVGLFSSWIDDYTVVVIMNSDMQISTVMALQSLKDDNVISAVTTTTALSSTSILEAILRSTVLAGFSVPLFDNTSEVWVLNADTKANSTYENFGYNSFAMLDSRYYGCKSDGLYLLEGDTDDGLPIRSSVNFGLQNFGRSELKRISNCYMGVSSSGTMYLKVTVEGSEYIYSARRDDSSLKIQRVDVGKGLRANYFQFEVYNSDGCDFDLSTVEFAAVVLDRRI